MLCTASHGLLSCKWLHTLPLFSLRTETSYYITTCLTHLFVCFFHCLFSKPREYCYQRVPEATVLRIEENFRFAKNCSSSLAILRCLGMIVWAILTEKEVLYYNWFCIKCFTHTTNDHAKSFSYINIVGVNCCVQKFPFTEAMINPFRSRIKSVHLLMLCPHSVFAKHIPWWTKFSLLFLHLHSVWLTPYRFLQVKHSAHITRL